VIISPQPPLLYLQDRLRKRLVEKALVDDAALLEFLSDAYVDACEQSRCLLTLATLVLSTAQEYALPADWSETRAVVAGGVAIQQVGAHDSIADRGVGAPVVRYQYGRTIGFSPVPTGGSALLLYAATPSRFSTWQDTLDPRFPAEYTYVLLHYVRWRVLAMAGGAQRIGLSNYERSLYDQGVDRLRRSVPLVDSTQPQRVRHISELVINAR
jgi:hypothetical protein